MSNISPEVMRFPIKSVERATLGSAPEVKAIRGPQGPQGPMGPPGPAGETKVVYVERKSDKKVNTGLMVSETKAVTGAAARALSITEIKFGEQKFSTYDWLIDDEIPETGESANKMEMWNNNDVYGIRHVQVYERVCADACPGSCPEDCIRNVNGLLVSTFTPTCFNGSTLTKIVGVLPFSSYHTGAYPYVPATGKYVNSFTHLEVANVAFASALSIADALANLHPDQVTTAVLPCITSGAATANQAALSAEIAALTTSGLHTLTGTYYVLVYCDGANKCANEAVMDVFSWYLAQVTGVTVTATGSPIVVTVDSFQITPLSPACEYPSDTVWATLRARGTCVSLPTRVLGSTTFGVDATGKAITTTVYEETTQVDKIPVYMQVPPFTWRQGSIRDPYSVAVPTSQTVGLTDKSGAVPQGSASHPIGLQYCTPNGCCPSVFGIRAGQFCGGCRVDSRIWGFRVMYYDNTLAHTTQELNWSRMLPFQSAAPTNTFDPVDFGAWALIAEAASQNPYSISDSILQLAIEKAEQMTTGAGDQQKLKFKTICSDKFRVDFILNPDPEGAGNAAPPMSAQTAAAEGITSGVFTGQTPGYVYARLNMNCSKKFSVTDLRLIGQQDTCPDDAKVLVQLRVHNNSDEVGDLAEDSREIGISLPYSNVTAVYCPLRSSAVLPREYHAVILSNIQHLPVSPSENLIINDEFYARFGNLANFEEVIDPKGPVQAYTFTLADGTTSTFTIDEVKAIKTIVKGVVLPYNYEFKVGDLHRNGVPVSTEDINAE